MKLLINSKRQRLHRWILGMYKLSHPTLYWACDDISKLGLMLIHVSKKGPRTILPTNSWYDCRIQIVCDKNNFKEILVSIGNQTQLTRTSANRSHTVCIHRFLYTNTLRYNEDSDFCCSLKGLIVLICTLVHNPEFISSTTYVFYDMMHSKCKNLNLYVRNAEIPIISSISGPSYIQVFVV